MGLIEREYRAHICPDCGAQVFGLGLCREHDPPGHPVETMMVPESELIVTRSNLRGAVESLEEFQAALREAGKGTVSAEWAEYAVGTILARLRT